MKGVILSGGNGTRLRPLTNLINKNLLPVFDRALIEYPLDTLLGSGIKDILIVSGREHSGDFIEYLGSGQDYGANFTYRVQEEAIGIAHALLLAEEFVGKDLMTVILGDNIFEESFSKAIKNFSGGARIFLKKVPDPERFGVAMLKGKLVSSVIEKPKKALSSFAVTGLYQYDSKVFDIIRTLKPSVRGELEITDVNNAYIYAKKMKAEFVKGFWVDAGTFHSLAEAVEWAKKAKEKVKGKKVW